MTDGRASCPRLVDYLCVVGSREVPVRSGHRSSTVVWKPQLLRRFPSEDYKDFPLPTNVVSFCQPEGCFVFNAKRTAQKETSFIFTLTDKDSGLTRFGICHNFYRKLEASRSDVGSNSEAYQLLSDEEHNVSKLAAAKTSSDSAFSSEAKRIVSDESDAGDNQDCDFDGRRSYGKSKNKRRSNKIAVLPKSVLAVRRRASLTICIPHSNNDSERSSRVISEAQEPSENDAYLLSQRSKKSGQRNKRKGKLKPLRFYSLTSLCLLSHYPFVSNFRECLNVLRKLIDGIQVPNKTTAALLATAADRKAHLYHRQPTTSWDYFMDCCTLTGDGMETPILLRSRSATSSSSSPSSAKSRPCKMTLHEIREVESWIMSLLSSPVPTAGQSRVELSLLPPRWSSLQPLLFALPDHQRFCLCDFPLHLPLELLGVNKCLQVLTLVLLEKKIVMQSHDYAALSFSILSITKMMYPLEYVFPVIPLLPLSMNGSEQLLLAPTPFIIGVPSNFLSSKRNFRLPDDIWLVDLDSAIIKPQSSNMNSLDVPALPEPDVKVLRNHLKQVLSGMSIQPIKNFDDLPSDSLSKMVENVAWTPPPMTNKSFYPFIFGNDVDSVDVATRVAMIRFFYSPNLLMHFSDHTRTLRVLPRPIVAIQSQTLLKSRTKLTPFMKQFCTTQAVEYFAEWSLNPSNIAFQKVNNSIFDPVTIGDKPKWYAHNLKCIDYNVWSDSKIFNGLLRTLSQDKEELDTDESGSDTDFSSSSSSSSYSDLISDITASDTYRETERAAAIAEFYHLTPEYSSLNDAFDDEADEDPTTPEDLKPQPPSVIQTTKSEMTQEVKPSTPIPKSFNFGFESDDEDFSSHNPFQFCNRRRPITPADSSGFDENIQLFDNQMSEQSLESQQLAQELFSNIEKLTMNAKYSSMESCCSDHFDATLSKQIRSPDDPAPVFALDNQPQLACDANVGSDCGDLPFVKQSYLFHALSQLSSSSQDIDYLFPEVQDAQETSEPSHMEEDSADVLEDRMQMACSHTSLSAKSLSLPPNQTTGQTYMRQTSAPNSLTYPLQRLSWSSQDAAIICDSNTVILDNAPESVDQDENFNCGNGGCQNSISGEEMQKITETRPSSAMSNASNFSFTTAQFWNSISSDLSGLAAQTSNFLGGFWSGSRTSLDKEDSSPISQAAPSGHIHPSSSFKSKGERRTMERKGSKKSEHNWNRKSFSKRTPVNTEANLLIQEIIDKVLAGEGIGWLKFNRLKKLMEEESHRTFSLNYFSRTLRSRSSKDGHVLDYCLDRQVWKGVLRMLTAIIHGLEVAFTSSSSDGMASALHLLEIAHTHYWTKEGFNKSSRTPSMTGSPNGNVDVSSHSTWAQNEGQDTNSLSVADPLASNVSGSQDFEESDVDNTPLKDGNWRLETQSSQDAESDSQSMSEAGSFSTHCISYLSKLGPSPSGSLSLDKTDLHLLEAKTIYSQGHRFHQGRLLQCTEQCSGEKVYLFESLIPATSPASRKGSIVSLSQNYVSFIWDDAIFWETIFYDAVARERELIGMDSNIKSMLERYKSLPENEKRLLEGDEDRLLSTILYNLTASMLLMRVNKTVIRKKIQRLLGKCHIGLTYSQELNSLIDYLPFLEANDVDLKTVPSRQMCRKTFLVHSSKDSIINVSFIEVREDGLVVRSTSGSVIDRWMFEEMVNMTYSPRNKALCLWRRSGGVTDMQKFYTKKCKNLYYCIKDAMEATLMRNESNAQSGVDVGGDFPVEELHTGEGGLLRVDMEGVRFLFAQRKMFIRLDHIKKCFTQKGGIFVIEEFNPKTRQLFHRYYTSPMADQICYSILCVFSYLAVAQSKGKAQFIAKTEPEDVDTT